MSTIQSVCKENDGREIENHLSLPSCVIINGMKTSDGHASKKYKKVREQTTESIKTYISFLHELILLTAQQMV
jgi:hypothetical protein